MNSRTRLPAVLGLLLGLLLAACNSTPAAPPATPTPKPTPNRSRPIKEDLDTLRNGADSIFHVGCQDAEKAACKDETRVCGPKTEASMRSAVAKKPIVVEWEAPRLTWAKNEGVLEHYWVVKPDGAGSYYYLLPSPDDVTTDCGGEYCGWHRDEIPAKTLFGAGKFHLTPHKGTEITDLQFCPPAPPQ